MKVVSVDELKDKDLVIISRKQLHDFMIEVNVKTSVDKRVKWIDRKTAKAKYKVTAHWLRIAEKDPFSMLQVMNGKGPTSPKKYKESSIQDEQQRQSECY